MTHPNEPQPTDAVAGVLSFLIPGLGQIYQGRIGKGVLFMVCLLSLFHVGQAMGNWQNVYIPPSAPQGGDGLPVRTNLVNSLINRWHYPGQFFIGIAAWPALWQYFEMPMPDREQFAKWHDFQRAPDETRVNEFLVSSDKTPDLGLMYTVIAGVLNILVIYDAFAGPAFPATTKKPKPNLESSTESPSANPPAEPAAS